MIRLLVISMVVAAIRAQVPSGYQSCQPCSYDTKPAPFYNLLASSIAKTPQAIHTSVRQVQSSPPAPSQPPFPPIASKAIDLMNSAKRAVRAGPIGVPTLAGIVLYSTNSVQPAGPPVTIQTPPAVFVPPSSLSAVTFTNTQVTDNDGTRSTSHIMTIPRKDSSFGSTPDVTYPSPSVTSYSNPSITISSPNTDKTFYTDNKYIPSAPIPAQATPPAPSQQQFFYNQPTPVVASCPATAMFYGPPQPVSFAQPTAVILQSPSYSPVTPASSYKVSSGPTYPPATNYLPVVGDRSSAAAAAAAASSASSSLSSAPAASSSAASSSSGSSVGKDSVVTFNIMDTTVSDGKPPGSSLEAENKDCSLPISPPLV